jgi:hypothetical protein
MICSRPGEYSISTTVHKVFPRDVAEAAVELGVIGHHALSAIAFGNGGAAGDDYCQRPPCGR